MESRYDFCLISQRNIELLGERYKPNLVEIDRVGPTPTHLKVEGATPIDQFCHGLL